MTHYPIIIIIFFSFFAGEWLLFPYIGRGITVLLFISLLSFGYLSNKRWRLYLNIASFLLITFIVVYLYIAGTNSITVNNDSDNYISEIHFDDYFKGFSFGPIPPKKSITVKFIDYFFNGKGHFSIIFDSGYISENFSEIKEGGKYRRLIEVNIISPEKIEINLR